MMACQLLAEITYLLRDPPSRYNPNLPSISSPNSTTQNTPRPSNIMPPADYPTSHGDHDDTVVRGLDHPRSSAGSLDPGPVHSRSNSLDVPRNLLIPSDQGSDTSGGEEVQKKFATLDTPVSTEIIPSLNIYTPRQPTNLPIQPPMTPDMVPSIVIASPTMQRRRSLGMRRISMPQRNVNLKPQGGSFDRQSSAATSPTSYITRKLSTFKDSFRRVRSAALKGNSRKGAVTKLSSPLLNRRKSISTPMSRASSHKSLCDDPLCNNLPWINVVTKLYQPDMLQGNNGTLLTSYKICCGELEGALQRLYTLPPRTTTDDDNIVGVDKRHYTLSPIPDDSVYSMSRREKGFSFSSSSSFSSSGTFSLNRFSRGSINFAFFGRRQSQLAPRRDSTVLQESRVTCSPNKYVIYDEELFGESSEGALERHAMMLQNKRIKENDNKKIKYLNKEVKGLLHTPFTILQLATAANLIDTNKIANLRDICWYLLLDTNQELVQSAGMS